MFGRKKKGRGSPGGLPRLTQIELTKKNLPLRIILLVLALGIAIAAFTIGFSSMVESEEGWTQISSTSGEVNCSGDFVLNYNLGASGASATTENKLLTTLYTQASLDAYRIFSNEYTADTLHNIYYVNQHINQEIQVDPALYKAFTVITQAKNRAIFLAPVYDQYQNLFMCETEAEAKLYDPTRNEELGAYIQQIMTFASDSTKINLQLLGNNKIRLNVAWDYLQFAKENELDTFVDFSWMKNAFIADYLAEVLIANNMTNGYIASYDGFTRNLCPEEESYNINLFQRLETEIFMPAVLRYSGGTSLVFLRDFPIMDTDVWHYYVFSDGRIANLMLDPATGEEKQAVTSLLCYSKSASCSEILMQMMPIYVADALYIGGLQDLEEQGIHSLYPDRNKVYASDPEAILTIDKDLGYVRENF